MKFHCRQQWQATLEPSGAGGAAKERESGITRKRAVGEGLEDFLEERRGYGDVNWGEAGWEVGSHGEEYCGEDTNGIAY